MENEIYQILKKHKLPLKKREEVLTDLLRLFSVSQQRELLLAYHKHLDNFNDPTIYNATEDMIDDYLANNCS